MRAIKIKPRGRQLSAKWTPTELRTRVRSSKQAIRGGSEVPGSACSTPSTHPAPQTGSRHARADDFWSDSSLAPSRSAVKNHRRAIAQLRPGATLTLGRAFLTLQRSPALRRCLGFAPQPLPRVTTGAAQARAAAAARVRQYRWWQRLLEMPYEPQGTTANSYYWLPHWSRCAPTMPLPHAQPWCPNPRCACTRAGSSSSRPVREHLVLQADRMDARGRGL